MVELVGLAVWEHHFPKQLSGGMQQRVGLARALAVDPEILLFDEPFSALDPLIRREMQDELLRLQRVMHKTIVFITHDFVEALRLGDQIAIMRDGRFVQVGTPPELVLRPENDYVSAFTKDAPRAKVLTAASIMQPAASDGRVPVPDGPVITAEAKLEDCIPVIAANRDPIQVVDAGNRWLGCWRLALLAVSGLVFMGLMGLWTESMQTLALMTVSVVISLLIGIPLGIWCAQDERVESTLRPILDAMQTMPAFVYLIPVLLFFGVARVPSVVATVIYALPPAIRLTSLGLRQVSPQAIEAARSFGATRRQMLFKVQIPLALPSIMAGVNQTIMMALGIVVIAALIGAGGLGRQVLLSLQHLKVGLALEAGVCIRFFAIILQRLIEGLMHL